jgi:hypothetical protein
MPRLARTNELCRIFSRQATSCSMLSKNAAFDRLAPISRIIGTNPEQPAYVEHQPATRDVRGISVDTETVVPTANPSLVTMARESADYRCDEGLVQLNPVRRGWLFTATDGAASRNLNPATPA